MSRPFYRGLSGSNGRFFGGGGFGDLLDESYRLKNFSDNGFGREVLSPFGASKSWWSFTINLLKLCIVAIILAALSGSLYWVAYISTASQATTHRGYQQLREKLVADLSVVGELSLGVGKLKELEFCPFKYENFVPCYYNVSERLNSAELDGQIDYEREYVSKSAKEQACLVLPPRDYKIPMRWPTGKDFIWKHNVKIKGQEFSSGTLTKRMMVEEEHISFHSDSLMVDGVEDYSHQIAEMIGLRNVSNFNEAGGWVIIRDSVTLTEAVRSVIAQLKWDARLIEIGSNKDERLLVCQKPFFKKFLE